jgi:mediator of RNA polymerase II transcription subunit 10
VLNEFKKLEELCDPHYDIEIPMDILNYIDEGKNPDLFTKDILEKCIKANESVKGKIEALEKFRQALEKEIRTTFPEHYAAYAKLKTEEKR